MVSLEPIELLDNHGAGRERVLVLVWWRARHENLKKTRVRSRCLIRVLGGVSDEVLDYLSGALHPRDWHAAWTGRLGAEYELYNSYTLRAGILYETSAIPEETLQIDFASMSRLAGTLGATARWRSFSLTAAWAHYFEQNREVTNSRVTRINPYPAPAFVIGNGRYSSSLDILAIQLAAAL